MKKLVYITILICEGIVCCLLKMAPITIPCFFKTIFSIPCPGCGLTRAFQNLLSFNIISALKYNILLIPLVVLIVILDICIIIDIITNKNTIRKTINILLKNYKLIFILLIISEIYNIFTKI